MNIPTLTPFDRSMGEYTREGWQIIPIPYGCKGKPPVGTIGYDGKPMDEEAMMEHEDPEGRPMGNLAAVMFDGMIGIDIDTAEGMENLRRMEAELGPLPRAYYVTSRGTIKSGFTIFFHTAKGLTWKDKPFEGGDLIVWHNRYQMLPPSYNAKRDSFYEWRTHNDTPLPFIPTPDDFPALPLSWQEALTKEALPSFRDDTEAMANLTSGASCSYVNAMLRRHASELTKGTTGRHGKMNRALWAFVHEAAKGHKGVEQAVESYRKYWKTRFTTTDRATPEELDREFDASLRTAIHKTSKVEGATPCTCKRAGAQRRTTPPTVGGLLANRYKSSRYV